MSFFQELRGFRGLPLVHFISQETQKNSEKSMNIDPFASSVFKLPEETVVVLGASEIAPFLQFWTGTQSAPN